MSVKITRIAKGWTLHVWLCEQHRAAKKSEGWSVEVLPTTRDDLPCDECVLPSGPKPIQSTKGDAP